MQQEQLNKKRREAVKLRLQGLTLAEITTATGLSAPTIITAHKTFKTGGWDAVNSQPRGRTRGQNQSLSEEQLAQFCDLVLSPPPQGTPSLWTLASLDQHLREISGFEVSSRTLNRYLADLGLPSENRLKQARADTGGKFTQWFDSKYPQIVTDAKNTTLLWTHYTSIDKPIDEQMRTHEKALFYTHTPRGKWCWLAGDYVDAIEHLTEFSKRAIATVDGPISIVLSGLDIFSRPSIAGQLSGIENTTIYPHPVFEFDTRTEQTKASTTTQSTVNPTPTDATGPLDKNNARDALQTVTPKAITPRKTLREKRIKPTMSLTHLERLEAESIHIMREVVAEADNPVMLYSIGKDSAVMLHLAMKAFYPAKPPFPLLHVDTGWKFQAMYTFRDKMVKDLGLQLITHQNAEGVEKGVNPFTHGSALHTDIMKTEALRQALDKHGFDAAFGGARRDEEKSRAKERIFSFRNEQHRWDPKNQRPELWNLYNARKLKGESIRAFPLSNWTELDIWQYIHLEGIPIVPLYLSAERPVVMRDGTLIMVDDDRMPMNPGEVPMMKRVRFRTLGCYPLTGAIESDASTLPEIIQEMLLANTSERQGRMIDHDSSASMEKKKQEGYF